MRDLQMYAKECIDTMNDLGIKTTVPAENFKVNNRAKRRWGQHSWAKHEIQINGVLLDERNFVDGLRNTIFHELIHSVPDCHDELIELGKHHGKEFHKYAKIVNNATGLKIQRTSSAREKGVVYEGETKPIKEFKMICDCGQVFIRRGYRQPKWYAHPENGYKCNCCGTRLRKDMRV